jgi:hypothetical protein
MTTKITLTSWDVKSSQRQHVINRLQRQCHGTILALECFVNTTCNGSLPHWSRKYTAAICRMRNATDQQHPFVAQVPSSEQLSGTSMFIHGIATFPVNDMPTCCCWIQDIGVSLNACRGFFHRIWQRNLPDFCVARTLWAYSIQSGSCNSTPKWRETSATWWVSQWQQAR